MEPKYSKKYILTFLSVLISAILIGIAIWGARPIQYNINNKIKIIDDKNNSYLLNKQFEDYKNELKENYKESLESINTKFNTIIALIGLAITVWLGLNIYNAIEREELKKLKSDLKKFEKEESEIKNKFYEIIKDYEIQLVIAKIDLDHMKAQNTRQVFELIELYNEIIQLINEYPKIKDDNFVAQIYLEYATVVVPTIDISGLEDITIERLNKALALTDNTSIKSQIYSQLAIISHICNNINEAIYYAEFSYEYDNYNQESAIILIQLLDEKNTNSSLLKLLEVAQDYKKISHLSEEKFNNFIEGINLKNIYKSKYKGEFEKIYR